MSQDLSNNESAEAQEAADKAAVEAKAGEGAPAADEAKDEGGEGSEKREVGEHGFPKDTPVAEMTVKEQAAYWKYQSRKNESRAKSAPSQEEYDNMKARLQELEEKNLSDEERASQEALEQARQEGEAEARKHYLPILQNAQLQGYASTVVSGERLTAWLSQANVSTFLDEDENVDGEKVVNTLEALFGQKEEKQKESGTKYKDFGQGRGKAPSSDKKAAGLAEALKRFGDPAAANK